MMWMRNRPGHWGLALEIDDHGWRILIGPWVLTSKPRL